MVQFTGLPVSASMLEVMVARNCEQHSQTLQIHLNKVHLFTGLLVSALMVLITVWPTL